MDTSEIIREIGKKKAPKHRSAHGKWVPASWVVRGLVEKENWGVSDAVREVVARLNLHPPGVAFTGVRAAYYETRKKPWP